MKDHKYKLATLVLSTGLLLSACGDEGNDEAQAPDTESDVEVETETEEGTDATSDDSLDGETDEPAEDSTGDATEDSSDDTTEDTSDDTSGDSADAPDDTEDSDELVEDSGEEGSTDEGGTESTESTGVAVLDQLGSTPEDAVSAAQENFDGELVELELDEEGDDWVYKVTLENDSEEYEVTLSAEDLSVLNEETDTDDDNDTEDQFAYEDAIPHDEAVQTAFDEVGGELEGWTLDRDDGQLEYEVELRNTDSGNDADVTIDAESGEVIEVDD